jgi:N-acetylglucosamine-6-sulfatase
VFTRRQQPSEVAADLTGKPAIRRALERLPAAAAPGPGEHQHPAYPWTGEETIRRRAEMILAVDESIGRVITTLESLTLLDKTLVVVTSDNGFFFGEHGLTTERRLPYEESIRNPLLMRYPARIPAGSRPEGMVLTVDLAPTVLDLTGVPIGPSIQGRSVLPLLQGTPEGWRQSILVEFYTNEQPFPHLLDLDYRAIRTARYKYVHWIKHPGDDELYDLQSDPLERRNRASDPGLASVKASLRTELGTLMLEAAGLAAR